MRYLTTLLLAALTFVVPLAIVPLAITAHAATLDEILAGPQRDPANAARDVYRHPKEVLEFFGVTPASRSSRSGRAAAGTPKFWVPICAITASTMRRGLRRRRKTSRRIS